MLERSTSHIGKGVALVAQAAVPVWPRVYRRPTISDSRNDHSSFYATTPCPSPFMILTAFNGDRNSKIRRKYYYDSHLVCSTVRNVCTSWYLRNDQGTGAWWMPPNRACG